jgi:hypothetical protein
VLIAVQRLAERIEELAGDHHLRLVGRQRREHRRQIEVRLAAVGAGVELLEQAVGGREEDEPLAGEGRAQRLRHDGLEDAAQQVTAGAEPETSQKIASTDDVHVTAPLRGCRREGKRPRRW